MYNVTHTEHIGFMGDPVRVYERDDFVKWLRSLPQNISPPGEVYKCPIARYMTEVHHRAIGNYTAGAYDNELTSLIDMNSRVSKGLVTADECGGRDYDKLTVAELLKLMEENLA